MFPNLNGQPLNPGTVAYQFDKEQARLGIPRIRPHDLRHTAATLMLQAGIPVKVVSERLGHSSIVVTMNRYAHVIEGMQETAAVVMDGLIFGHGDQTVTKWQLNPKNSL